MESKESRLSDKFAAFEYDRSEDTTQEARYKQIMSMTRDFYSTWIDSGRTSDEFFDMLRDVTVSRNLLNLSVAARAIDETNNAAYTELSDKAVLQQAWYESFLQCAYVAEEAEHMSVEELKELRDYALEKMANLDTYGADDASFVAFTSELNWYSHVAYGATVLAGIPGEEAMEYTNATFKKLVDGRPGLATMHFREYQLFKDKISLNTEDTGAVRESARYVVEGLDDDPDAERAARSFISVQYLNLTKDGMYRINEERTKDWREFIDLLNELYPDDENGDVESIDLEKFKPTEVDWEVLPAGKLKDFAREVAEGASSGLKEVHIDPTRLKVLEKIRTQWGADRSYFAKGSLKSRKVRKIDNQECPDQYIMLILQDFDDQGTITEHAVAESPIAGEHAMYMFRQDVNPDVSWRKVMSVDKKVARPMGARPIKHPSNLKGDDLVDVMAERAAILLSATREEFMRLEFKGKRFYIGNRLAIKAFSMMAEAQAV